MYAHDACNHARRIIHHTDRQTDKTHLTHCLICLSELNLFFVHKILYKTRNLVLQEFIFYYCGTLSVMLPFLLLLCR